MDASDGLADSLIQIAKESRVGMSVDLALLPLHEETKLAAKEACADLLEWGVYGGEDYELVACIPGDIWKDWKNGNPFSAIGIVTDTAEIAITNGGNIGSTLDITKTFQHFPR